MSPFGTAAFCTVNNAKHFVFSILSYCHMWRTIANNIIVLWRYYKFPGQQCRPLMDLGPLSTCQCLTKPSIITRRVCSEESWGKFSAASLLYRVFATKCLTGSTSGQKGPVRVAFMGDSRMRQVYRAFIRFVDTGLFPGVQIWGKWNGKT